MKAFYNEIDPYCCAWLSNLMDAGMITPGTICSTPVQELTAKELSGYGRLHFFAGIGGWELALRLAGWPEERTVWTGSCPCQPFSVAGKGKAQADERHLWPHWFRLIAEVRPAVIFGEQVAGAIAHGWLDDAFDDLEGEGYETGSAVLPACSVGAPHRRDRLWFVGYTDGATCERDAGSILGTQTTQRSQRQSHGSMPHRSKHAGASCAEGIVANTKVIAEREQADKTDAKPAFGEAWDEFKHRSYALADDTRSQGWLGGKLQERTSEQPSGARNTPISDSPGTGSFSAAHAGIHSSEKSAGPWDVQSQRYDWWGAEPAVGRVAHGIPARAHKLRAYGNAIVPQAAAEFIAAFMVSRP